MATTFLLDEAAPFFRKDEKEDIIASLLSVDDATLDTDPPKVICIFGMGGLGKTTLAKSVYNHREVQECFDVKAWISVREEFDVFRILKQILEVTAGTSEHNSTRDHQNILLELKEKLEEKKYLIVLDDVWNDNKADWDSLLGHLKTARTSQGSRIIITTRNETVAFAAGAVRSLLLRFLRNEECWSLFTHHAFGNDDSTEHHRDIEIIGKEIAKKCKGLPIAAKMLGSLCHFKKDVEEWKNISKSMDDNLDFDILPAVKLSYDNLPSHLKACFAYFAKFPRDYEFANENLVHSWIEEGLIQSEEENRTKEEVAGEYFQDLVSRSFFIQSSKNTSCFVMHELMHDLAMYVSKEFFQDSTVQRDSEVAIDWGITLVNVSLEILLVTFDQIASPKKPHCALIALVLSLAAMFVCITELVHKGRKHNITLQRQGFGCSLHCPSSSDNPYTYIDAFILASAVAQLIFSSIAFSFLHRGAENPIKVSFASIIFIICMTSSKFVRAPDFTGLPITREN